MKRAIVTGGAGFIGSHLSDELAERGYKVTILDDISTGKLSNIEALRNRGNIDFVQGSITDLPQLQKLFKGSDYIFHQAALARVPFSVSDPLSANEVNITGTLKVLIAARDNGVKKVMFASSSSVYGDAPVLPQREDMLPIPLSPYALTKLAGEYYCTIFKQLYGLSTVCLRYFNVYGPRQDPHSQYAMVIPAFINRIAHHQSPIIFGDGEQSRDFTFIRDVIQANILAAESTAEGVFNIGGGKNITINRLADLILKIMNSDLEPVYQEPRPGDVRHTLADVASAKSFGYEPGWTLETGLKEIINDYKHGG
jgi:UDP-glucose 4-epimerase